MSEKDNNLTPWQQKHLEYQKRKAEEAKKEKKANQPKKVHFSSTFLKKWSLGTSSSRVYKPT